jgi:hypothetical protein
MTVYLLSCLSRNNPTSFFDLWVSSLIGRIVHVELVFISNESIYAYWITLKSVQAQFKQRNLSVVHEQFDVLWHKLLVTKEEEDSLVSYCVATAPHTYFSVMHYFMAGFPFKHRGLATFFWSKVYGLNVSHAEQDGKTPEFCASLLIKVFQAVLGRLKDMDPYDSSASDVLVALKAANMVEEQKEDPVKNVFEMEQLTERYGIIRSSYSEELYKNSQL